MEARLYIITSNKGLWALWGNKKVKRMLPAEMSTPVLALGKGETIEFPDDGSDLVLTFKRIGR